MIVLWLHFEISNHYSILFYSILFYSILFQCIPNESQVGFDVIAPLDKRFY